MRVGGGLSSVPRIARDLGVFVPKEEAIEVLRAILDAWTEDLKLPRLARQGADEVHGRRLSAPRACAPRVEARLGRTLDDFELPPPPAPSPTTSASTRRSSRASSTSACPCTSGSISGDQMIAVADLAERLGGDVRLTRQQNFIVANVPEARVDEAVAELGAIGFPLDVNHVRGGSIACTGEPHCNFSVTETKTRLGRADRAPRGRASATTIARPPAPPRRLPARLRPALGRRPRLPGHDRARRRGGARRQAYDIFLRGGLGPDAAIARPLFRRVPDRGARRRGRRA